MPVTAFLKLCRHKHLIPHTLNIEDLIVFIQEIYTPMTLAEHKWMVESAMLNKIYREDVNSLDSRIERHEDEPKLQFHEFILLLAVIATRKNTSDVLPCNKIENFFVQSLEFTKVEESERFIPTFDEAIEEDDDSEESFELDDQQSKVRKFLEQRQALDGTGPAIDFEEVLNTLDEALPMIPGRPEVIQVQPRP